MSVDEWQILGITVEETDVSLTLVYSSSRSIRYTLWETGEACISARKLDMSRFRKIIKCSSAGKYSRVSDEGVEVGADSFDVIFLMTGPG